MKCNYKATDGNPQKQLLLLVEDMKNNDKNNLTIPERISAGNEWAYLYNFL